MLDTTNIELKEMPAQPMTDDELNAQYKRCQAWKDPEQWLALAEVYYSRGYLLNAERCVRNAAENPVRCGVVKDTEETRSMGIAGRCADVLWESQEFGRIRACVIAEGVGVGLFMLLSEDVA